MNKVTASKSKSSFDFGRSSVTQSPGETTKLRLELRALLPAFSLILASTASAQWLTNGTSIYYNGGKVGSEPVRPRMLCT